VSYFPALIRDRPLGEFVAIREKGGAVRVLAQISRKPHFRFASRPRAGMGERASALLARSKRLLLSSAQEVELSMMKWRHFLSGYAKNREWEWTVRIE
jgi:hypothetical protein